MAIELMRRRVVAARVGRLATVDGDGAPHLVPVCFVLDGDDLYWAVDRKPKSTPHLKRLENLRARPVAQLLVDEFAEDWSRLWWVRVTTEAEILPPGDETERALDLLSAKYPQYRAARPPGPVVRLRCRRWRGWSAA